MDHRILWLCSMLISLCSFHASALEISIDYSDTQSPVGEGFWDSTVGAARRAAFEHAVSIWEEKIGGTVPISIRAEFNNLAADTNGETTITQAWANLSGFPEPGWGFVAALASQLNGNNLPDSSGNHFFVQFNTDFEAPASGSGKWYYGLDGLVPPGDKDFVTTAIHEIGHGLGMADNINPLTGGYLQVAPLYYLFFVVRRGATNLFFDEMSNNERLAAITSGEVYFAGPNVIAASIPNPQFIPDPNNPPVNSNGEAKLFAPTIFSDSFVSHWDAFHVAHGHGLLMLPSSPQPATNIDYTKELLVDLGWTFQPEPQIHVNTAAVNFDSTHVNAGASASKFVEITNTGQANLRIFSISLQDSIVGPGKSEFQLISGGGSATLTPMESRQVEVAFDPTSTSFKQADLQILCNDTHQWIERVRLKGLAFDGTAATAWVDFNFVGDEMGTEAAPFDSATEGSEFVMAGGTINFAPGSTSETVTINKAMTLVNIGSGARGTMETTVRIGDLSAMALSGGKRETIGKSKEGFVSAEK